MPLGYTCHLKLYYMDDWVILNFLRVNSYISESETYTHTTPTHTHTHTHAHTYPGTPGPHDLIKDSAAITSLLILTDTALDTQVDFTWTIVVTVRI